MDDETTVARAARGKYRLVRELGRGGFGTVWLAHDTELSRPVAIKFLSTRDPAEVVRFKREAQTAARLSHPGIVSVYDVGESGGEHFIVMELVDGRPAAGPIGARDAAELVRQAAEAVQHAHDHGIVHRDLKPGNILVADGKAKVMDFGMAKHVGAESSVSMTGDVMGTPAYMSPEQARGQIRSVDARSDVWSLGATLHSLCTGRSPFDRAGSDVYELLRRVVDEDPPAPRIDREIDTIVLKCLEKDPARRYATARELADDLRRYLAGEPIAAHPPSFFYRTRKRLAKRKLLAAVALVALGALATAAFVEGRRRYLESAVYPMVEGAREKVRSAEEMLHRPKFAVEPWKAKLDAAERECLDALDLHEDYAPAYVVLGLIEVQRGDMDAAIDRFTRALEINPDYTQALAERANAYAERVFAEEHESQPGDLLPTERIEEAAWANLAARDLERASLAQQEGEDRIAAELLVKMLKAATKMEPGGLEAVIDEAAAAWNRQEADERALRIAAEAAHRRQRFALAVEFQRKFVEIRRGDARAWARLAHFCGDAEQAHECLEASETALRLNPDVTEAHLSRGLARRALGDPDGAMEDLNRAAALFPRNPQVFVARSMVYRTTGDFDRAMADLDTAVALTPTSSSVFTERAIAKLEGQDFAGVIRDATEAIRLNSHNMTAYIWRGLAREATGDPEGARQDHEEACRKDPRDGAPYLQRAMFRQRRGDARGAIADIDRAVELDGEDPDMHWIRAIILVELGQDEQACESYARVLRLSPKNAAARANLAQACLRLGRFEASLSNFDLLVTEHPDDVISRKMRADARATAGDPAGALEDYNRAVEMDPADPAIFLNRGCLHMDEGRWDEAIADASSAIELDPRFVGACSNRATCYLTRGDLRAAEGRREEAVADWVRAEEDLRAALDVEPQNRELIEGTLREVRGKLSAESDF